MEEKNERMISFFKKHRDIIDIFMYVILIGVSIIAVSIYAELGGIIFYAFNSLIILLAIINFKLFYKKSKRKFYSSAAFLFMLICFIELIFYNAFSGVLKPVIYLYPEKEQDVSVKLHFKGDLTVSYPKYDNSITGWKVKASPNGTLFNLADNKEYSYLFWEGISNNKYDIKSGFVVPGTDTETFLQESLSRIGLIPKEYNEFIVFWLPRMMNNKYNLIYFAQEDYTETAKLDIEPNPDTVIRVFMVYKPINSVIDLPKQELKSHSRKGFVVVEWGGSEIGR